MRFFLSGTLLVFTDGNFYFFHAHIFRFHGWDLAENFTGTVDFSRAVSKKFSREGKFFHGRKSKKFHGKDFFFFTGKKKSTAPTQHNTNNNCVGTQNNCMLSSPEHSTERLLSGPHVYQGSCRLFW